MKDTAPIGQGIIAVAALFGIVGGGVAYVMYDYAFIGAVFIGGLVAALVAVLLWLGWRKPNAPYSGRPEIEAADLGQAEAPSATAGLTAAGDTGASTASSGSASASGAASAAGGGSASGAGAAMASGGATSAVSGSASSGAASGGSAAAASAAPAAAAAAGGPAAAGSAAAAGASSAASGSAPAARAAPAAAPAATAKANGADSTPDYDGDGVKEGTDEGKKPEALDGPRGGTADNLKEIKGIGPKLEKLCNSLGFYHFDQIAAWSADEVAWVDANLEGFKGRVTRDTWVAQAKILAAGGETEFSKKVDKGGVY